MKNIRIHTDFITLGQLLKFLGIIDNGAGAKPYLTEHNVFVNNEKEDRRGRKLYPEYIVQIENETYKVEK